MMYKWIIIALLFSNLAAADVENREGRLLTPGPPIYPAYCLKKSLQGEVEFVFTVNTEGEVRDPSVLNVIVFRRNKGRPSNDKKAERAFVAAAKKALSNYRYQPPIVDGQLVEMRDVKSTISFRLGR